MTSEPGDDLEPGATATLAGGPPGPAARLVLVRAGGRVLALPLAAVREVVPARPAVRLPGAGPAVRGLVNVRGRVTTVLDLAACLGLPPLPPGPDQRIVLVGYRDRTVGLAVDEVDRLLDVGGDPAAAADVPEPVSVDIELLLDTYF
jgi:chemotaxis signal transduction protein